MDAKQMAEKIRDTLVHRINVSLVWCLKQLEASEWQQCSVHGLAGNSNFVEVSREDAGDFDDTYGHKFILRCFDDTWCCTFVYDRLFPIGYTKAELGMLNKPKSVATRPMVQ